MPCRRGRIPQKVLQRGLQAEFTVRGDAQGRGNPVGGEKAHALQVLHQAVRIIADDVRRTVPVQAADFHGELGGNTVALQKNHGLPSRLLLLKALGNLPPALAAHAGNLLETLGVLAEHFQRLHAEMLHNLPGGGRPHPVNQPAAQVTLNAQQAGGLMDSGRRSP